MSAPRKWSPDDKDARTLRVRVRTPMMDAPAGAETGSGFPTPPEENDMTDITAPSFETDIKPLFRDRDRGAMLRAFDLWSYDDVKANADRILAAVRAGSM